jgi:transcriptional regulator GlxA family with amidase domain
VADVAGELRVTAEGRLDLLGLDPGSALPDARALLARYRATSGRRRGRPPSAAGELTEDEVGRALTDRYALELSASLVDVAEDLGVGRRTLQRFVAEDLGVTWRELLARFAPRRWPPTSPSTPCEE